MATDFTAILLDWYARHGRELPWRGGHDPYAIWLSEVILQQTRIQQGWAYWERFMRLFPTVQDLAAATEDAVLRAWQGLGYYSRARNLHAAARQVVALGGFPRTVEGLRKLRGVGPYTAAAIGSMAFGLPTAVVDGNVYRVLSRHFGIETPINSTEGQHLFAALAQELLPTNRAADFNQAMMDFGAIQCTPRNPACVVCPLAERCVALREGRVGELPVKLRKTSIQTRHLIYIYIRYKGEVAIRRRPSGDIWQGLWEPLLIEKKSQSDALAEKSFTISSCESENILSFLEKGQLELLPSLSTCDQDETLELSTLSHAQDAGCEASSLARFVKLTQGVKHVLTHRILLADFYLAEFAERPTLPAGYVWVTEATLDDYAKPRLIELLLEKLP